MRVIAEGRKPDPPKLWWEEGSWVCTTCGERVCFEPVDQHSLFFAIYRPRPWMKRRVRSFCLTCERSREFRRYVEPSLGEYFV